VWRASNSISFLTLHLCPNKFLNANSYDAGQEEISCTTGYKNATYSIIEMDFLTLHLGLFLYFDKLSIKTPIVSNAGLFTKKYKV
jgi:hypothetical protein